MKERPILMSGPMVRAILAGTKTQTRRPVKLNSAGRAALGGRNWHLGDPECVQACPFGQPGDRLWVREKWSADFPEVGYADGIGIEILENSARLELFRLYDTQRGRWRPSIHMPRWACRLVLEIVNVRVKRVQGISGKDARAEGFESMVHPDAEYFERAQRDMFSRAWDGIYAVKGQGWDANPWVWVIEFKRVAGA